MKCATQINLSLAAFRDLRQLGLTGTCPHTKTLREPDSRGCIRADVVLGCMRSCRKEGSHIDSSLICDKSESDAFGIWVTRNSEDSSFRFLSFSYRCTLESSGTAMPPEETRTMPPFCKFDLNPQAILVKISWAPHSGGPEVVTFELELRQEGYDGEDDLLFWQKRERLTVLR